jgi:osmotically-inducible protein OsmY
MKRLFIIGLMVTLPSFSFMACQDRGGDGAKMSNSTAQISNADLANNIKTKLDSDPQLQTANLKVSADAEKNVATLSGTLESSSLRVKAIDLAKSAQPGLTIEDQIEITSSEVSRKDYTEQMAQEEWAKAKQLGEKVGKQLDDAWIHGKIVSKLVVMSKTSPRTVNVDVNNSVVTLRGTVQDAEQKSEAARIAQETDGVKRVDNRLKVNA